MSKDIDEIKDLLEKYQEALNTGSADDAVLLFAPDGILMAQHFQTSIGTKALQKAYEAFLSRIDFDVRFELKEIVPTAPNWAFARSESAGTTIVKGKGPKSEANQELFILQKVPLGGDTAEWKIARYCFSTTNASPR